MANEVFRNIRLGAFVIVATVFLITALYLIGNKQNLFGSTFRVSAEFHNVNGLAEGNNVRFAGIDVGTVESVEIINDTSVRVVMLIKDKVRRFIKKNAMASIGTDGLMGNKLVNINSVTEYAAEIEEGDVLLSLKPIETDEMLRTLSITNDNIGVISQNLRSITQKINSSNSLWSLLMDTVVAENVKNAIVSIRLTGHRSATITGDLSDIVRAVKQGEGTMGALLTDTAISGELQQTIVNIQLLSDKMAVITGDMAGLSDRIKSGEGAIGTLLMDTAFVHALNSSMKNIKTGTVGFNEIMEALKHNILFRRYFRKKEKG